MDLTSDAPRFKLGNKTKQKPNHCQHHIPCGLVSYLFWQVSLVNQLSLLTNA